MSDFIVVPSRKITGSTPAPGGGGGGLTFTLIATDGITTNAMGGAPISGSGGAIQLDLGYSPSWTGVHTYAQPIEFAAAQTFAVSKLQASGQQSGDLLFYNAGSWSRLPLGAGGKVLLSSGGTAEWGDAVTSLTTGAGLSGGTITQSGTISLDVSYSPAWSGSHSFSNPITFAAAQTFSISKLSIASEAAGDLIYRNGSGWSRLPAGGEGSILKVSGSTLAWGSLTLSETSGTLPLTRGGTGITSYSEGDMLYVAPGGTAMNALAAGSSNASLRIENGQPTWKYETGWMQNEITSSEEILIPEQRQQQIQGALAVGGVYNIEGKTVIL